MKPFGAWFEALKDMPTNDLLMQHINKYPEKRDYEITKCEQEEENEQQEENEQSS